MADWISLFAVYRVVVIRNDEVVQGILQPEYSPDHPRVRAALATWEGTHFLHHGGGGTEVTLVRSVGGRAGERWWLHLALGLLTLLTTTLSGAYFLGRDPLRLALYGLGPLGIPVPVRLFPEELVPGLLFSVPLLLILLGHEMGHYLTARRYRMDVSPPYFIPAPHWLNVIGTFGAFIRLRSAMVNRVMLLDVGAAGPVASFVLSVPAVLLGAAWSERVALPGAGPTSFLVVFDGQPIWLGGSLAFHALVGLVGASGGVLALHPLAFAGWLGLFVTALNLFPLAQLDGGHILYGLLGPGQRWVGRVFLALLLVLGVWWWGWWLWAGLILVLGRGSIGHPAVFDPEFPVTGGRRWLGRACILIFGLTFVPLPIQI